MTTAADDGRIDAIRAALAADPQLAGRIARIQVSTRRKSLGLAMRPGDSGITLQAPSFLAPDEVYRLVSKNRDRIGSMLLKAKECVPDRPVKEFVNGEGFLWLGRSKRLRLVDSAPEQVCSVDDHGCVTSTGRWLQVDRASLRHGSKTFIDWYGREGTPWLQEHARYIWSRMSARPMPTVRAGDIGRTRWGKHTARGDAGEIVIAWQTLQLSPSLVRHVLTHELTHATRPQGTSHGPEFWRVFERAETGARQTVRLLNEEGRHVWMGDAVIRAEEATR